jgi:hypothetical protein
MTMWNGFSSILISRLGAAGLVTSFYSHKEILQGMTVWVACYFFHLEGFSETSHISRGASVGFNNRPRLFFSFFSCTLFFSEPVGWLAGHGAIKKNIELNIVWSRGRGT